MIVDQDAAEATVKIRLPQPRHRWTRALVTAGAGLALAGTSVARGQLWVALVYVTLAFGAIPLNIAVQSFGVDLTPGFAVVRWLRRRRVSWARVQAVVSHDKPDGSSAVWLMLENGEPVKLRCPRSLMRKGDAQYERELQLMEQWWVEHRGASWVELAGSDVGARLTTGPLLEDRRQQKAAHEEHDL
jgi:hypothetical protein